VKRALVLLLCAGTAHAGHKRKHAKPAKLTVHIKNPTNGPITIDTTYGFDGFPHAPFCQTECPACSDRRCGSPMHTDQTIPAHGSIDAEWDAIDYAGSQGAGGCGCYTATPMAAGTQEITVSGMDAAGSMCSGTANVVLPAKRKSVKITLACGSAAGIE
jgi:hypothetical protein